MTALFNCSQADFIIVVNTGLNSYREYLPQFTNFSPKYTVAWGDSLQDAVDAVQMMPIEDARRAESEALRVLLAQKNRQACSEWQKLKRYITNAYDENLVNIKLMAAGQNLYSKSLNESWPSAQMMYSAAVKFMTANLTTLTENDNMPPAFPAAFEAVITEFKTLLSGYEDSKETMMVETQDRLVALNKIYRTFMPMMLDGQEIFRDNEAVRTQFVFTDVLNRVGGPGLAGIDGTVQDDVTNMPVAGAQIKLFNPNSPDVFYTAISDGEGNYVVNSPSGTYTIEVAATGYSPFSQAGVTVEVGTVSRLNVKLVPENGGE